MAVLMWSVHS